jgi:polyphosphate kinase
MSKSKSTHPESNLSNPKYYLNRELSWLEFNRRVLHEALNPQAPLLERLKFVSIFCSNLDEFFMIRVSTLKEQVQADDLEPTPDGRTAEQQLDEIYRVLSPMITEQHQLFEEKLRPELTEFGIALLNYEDLDLKQRSSLDEFFQERVFPILTPLVVDVNHPFPGVSNLSLNLAAVIQDPETKEEKFARVKVPALLPRFIELPESQPPAQAHRWTGVPVEQVIGNNLESLFPGMKIQHWCVFRVTRDADFPVGEEETEDLRAAIETEISKRRLGGDVVRLEVQANICPLTSQMLIQGLNVTAIDIYQIDGMLNLKDLISLATLPFPDLKDAPWTPLTPVWLKPALSPQAIDPTKKDPDIFSLIRDRDRLVHHPYDSFTASVLQFITQAAADPQVLAIKLTLYRTSGDSAIVQALIKAAERGKEVVVLIELKARFDEANNINWANRLNEAGAHVAYGVSGLKTHTKVMLIVRQESDPCGNGEAARIRRYVHIGTGNYNSKTATLYTDLGLFSCRKKLGADLTDLFNYLTGCSHQSEYQKLIVAPVNIRGQILSLIEQETKHAKHDRPAKIVAKMNSLVDPEIIQTLYQASQEGVQIDLIIRGSCCLRPGIQGISENIRVISIIGRFLEHSRIFYFNNGGHPQVLIGSADWMQRNLDRRVEAIVPIDDAEIQKRLVKILKTLLNDNCKAWELRSTGEYTQRHPTKKEDERNAQVILMNLAKSESSGE